MLSLAEIGALIVALLGLFGAVLNHRTQADATGLERLKTIQEGQAKLLSTLEAQLDDSRERQARLEQQIVDRDRTIEQLQRDLNAAHDQIRELQGRAALTPTLQQQVGERDQTIAQLRLDLATRDRTIETLRGELAERDQTIEELRGAAHA